MLRGSIHSARTILKSLFLFSLILSSIFISGCGKGEFSRLEVLPVDEYLKRPGNFLGNNYLLSAQIDSQIEWQEGIGRILAVETEDSKSRLPVFVPESAGKNLHVGQRYEMHVTIRKGGLIYVEDLRKF